MPIKRIPPAAGGQVPEKLWITPIGGLAQYYLNSSGGALAKGHVVRFSASTSNSVVYTAVDDVNPIGIVWEDIPDGKSGWIVIAGIADFYTTNTGTTARGYWIGVSDSVIGQADTHASPPNATEHFREIGHTSDTRSGAGLVRGCVHFN